MKSLDLAPTAKALATYLLQVVVSYCSKNGEKIKELARSAGVSQHTIYHWKKKFGDMTVNEAKRYKAIEAENAKLKKIVADLTLDNMMLKEVNSKKW